MKLDEVESTVKHPEFMNGHLQILSKRKYKEEYQLLPWEFNIVGYYNRNNDPKNNVTNNDPKIQISSLYWPFFQSEYEVWWIFG